VNILIWATLRTMIQQEERLALKGEAGPGSVPVPPDPS
jgi:hypothetical protein